MRIDYLIAILTYLTILIVVGGFLARRVKSGEDFMVAGRSATRARTDRKHSSPHGSVREASWGMRACLIASDWPRCGGPIGAAIGIAIIYFIAARARNYGGFTIPDVLETRYHPAARVLATIVTVVAYTVHCLLPIPGGRASALSRDRNGGVNRKSLSRLHSSSPTQPWLECSRLHTPTSSTV